jgi:hypothetical protein
VGTRVLFSVDFSENSENQEVPKRFVFGDETLMRRKSSEIWRILMAENPCPYRNLSDFCCCPSAFQRPVSYVELHRLGECSLNPPHSARQVGVGTVLLLLKSVNSMNCDQASGSYKTPGMMS